MGASSIAANLGEPLGPLWHHPGTNALTFSEQTEKYRTFSLARRSWRVLICSTMCHGLVYAAFHSELTATWFTSVLRWHSQRCFLLEPVMYVVLLPLRAACCHPQRRAAEPRRAELWPQREAALPFMSCGAPSITAQAAPLIYDVTWGCCVGLDSGDTSEGVGGPTCWRTDVVRMFVVSPVASTDTESARVHETVSVWYI